MGLLECFYQSKPKIEISVPYDAVHLTHVIFDKSTRKFEGLPMEWKRLLYPREDNHNRQSPAPPRRAPPAQPVSASSRPFRAPRYAPPLPASSAVRPPPLSRHAPEGSSPSKPPNLTQQEVPTRSRAVNESVHLLHLPPPRPHRLNVTSHRDLPKVPSTPDFELPEDTFISPAKHVERPQFDFTAFRLRLRTMDPQGSNDSDVPLAEMDWSRYLVKDEDAYAGDGRFGTVYKGIWNLPTGLDPPPDVAIKVIRHLSFENYGHQNVTMLPVHVRREVRVWKDLRHPNILPFIGVAKGNGAVPSLVSLWMENGTIRDFLHRKPSANRVKLVIGVARGLHYLHTYDPQITHGDLKAVNILVDAQGRPRLGDFGLSRMFEDQSLWITSATSAPGTTRWMAPELLTGEQPFITPESDVYAFGMTSWEIMANRSPFSRYKLDAAVLAAVTIRDERPERLASMKIPDRLWLIMTNCWATNVAERPTMQHVIEMLNLLILN